MGGKNPSDINFASIGNQIQFVDTIKYFQQSLAALAKSLTDKEKNGIYRKCEKFLKNDPKFSKQFMLCTDEKKKWVLNYLSSGKGTIPYELITQYDSLDIVTDDGYFFRPHQFFSSLKDNTLSEEEYEQVKKSCKTLKLKDLGELNKIYNFQVRSFCVRYLNNVLAAFKRFSNIILGNVILLVLSVGAFKGKKVSVV